MSKDVTNCAVELTISGYDHRGDALQYRVKNPPNQAVANVVYRLQLYRLQHALELELTVAGTDKPLNMYDYSLEYPKGLTQLDRDIISVLKAGAINVFGGCRRMVLRPVRTVPVAEDVVAKESAGQLYELLTAARDISDSVTDRLNHLCEQRELGNESVEDEIVVLARFLDALAAADHLGLEGNHGQD